jgi:hypothetical protein
MCENNERRKKIYTESIECFVCRGRCAGSSQYQVIENAQVDICFCGCEMTSLSTGQTVRVYPKDSVVIDNGVMNVTSGN